MKTSLFRRLGLMVSVALILSSCRHDYLPEKETYSNSSAFHLTSKRISLNEAKHKDKLVTEISKAKAEIEAKSKTDAKGKVINYGNGVSIDTDQITYIENGPHFHTYTFIITRENALPEDPVENLVLAPLSDGTYKELLVSYDLTPSEKQILMNGGFVDTKGKTTITELAKDTYSPLSKGLVGCGWAETYTFKSCSANEHGSWNPDQWGECTADRKPGFYSTMTYICDFVDPTDSPPSGGGSGVSGGGSGSEGGSTPCTDCPPPPEPCNGNGAATEPLDPTTDTGDGSSCSGVPTIITLPPPGTDPCRKIKAQRNDEAFTKRIDTLQGKTGLTKETGYIQKWGGSYEYQANAGATDNANTLSLPQVADNTWVKAYMHTHPDDIPNSDKKGIKMFSPADVVYFMDLIKNAQDREFSLSDPYAVMVTSAGNYQIRFTGNKYQIKTFTKQDAEYHREPFSKLVEDYLDKPKQLEFRFLKYIQKEMLLYGITLYRMNTDGTTTEIKLNADKTNTAENTCP